MADGESRLFVQVFYYQKDGMPVLCDLCIPEGATLQDALLKSSAVVTGTASDLTNLHVGIYGKIKPLETILRDRDRVEIYQSLIADPKEMRRRRAEKKSRDAADRP
jgi:uncharacterized protein